MFLRKQFFVQNINPKTVFTIIVWLIAAWVLSRPLQVIGKNIYKSLGTLTSQVLNSVSESKSTAEELFKSRKLINQKSKIISALKVKVNYLEDEVKETKKLKDLLDLKRNLNYKTIGTTVIGRSADNWHKQIIISKGENSGISQGDVVLTSKGIVGQIVDTSKDTSIVQLISDSSYKLGCKIKEKNILGILSGKTNTIGLLEFIPVGTDIMTGDLVVTSGITSTGLPQTYPIGHPVGRIIKVSRKKNKPSDLYIEVKLSENLNSLSSALVFSSD